MTRLLFFAAFLLFPFASHAQNGLPTNSDQPIEITATKTVEWLREQKQYVARENVIVTQGTMVLHADLLTADYKEGANSSMEIWRLTAEGNVEITDGDNTGYGSRAVYDVPAGVAVLTGEGLRLVSPDQTVTARDRMEYHANERYAKAVGDAKVVRAKDTLTADTITAFFKDQAEAAKPANPAAKEAAPGGGSVDRLEADGDVTIKTPAETVTGSKAVYKADTNTATITGKVKVARGPNTLEGEKAEVNLTTNVSKMFGSTREGGRVRGVFFPGSEKSDAGAGKKGAAEPDQSVVPVQPPVAPQSGPFEPSGSAMPAPKPADALENLPVPNAESPAKVAPRVDY